MTEVGLTKDDHLLTADGATVAADNGTTPPTATGWM
jgi:hypothetical protein